MRYSTTTRRLAGTVAGAAALAGAACKDPTSVPDLNNLPISTIAGGLNANLTQLLVTGLISRDRNITGIRYYQFSETLARDVYNIDPSEPRFQTELLGNAIDAAGFIGASGGFTEAFNAVATANTIINGADAVADYSAAQKNGVKGIAHTFKALALYRALELRGTNGIPLDNSPVEATPAQQLPIRCEPAALAAISATLDSGATELAAAGTAFAVTLPTGFTSNGNFGTPATFLRFNRGLAGRTEFYRGLRGGGVAAFTRALTALNASFASTTAPTTDGVYSTFAAAPDIFNPLAVGTIYLNPTVTTAAAGAGAFGQSQVLQSGDTRASKVTTAATTTTRNGVSSNLRTTVASTAQATRTRPLPILRNAELLLLRAQAEIELSQLPAATADINSVRTREGGLAAIPTVAARDEGVQRVLYEKRFSLLLEGAQRLVDLRSYGLLNAANLGASQRGTADTFQTALPIPQQERDARGGNFTCQQ